LRIAAFVLALLSIKLTTSGSGQVRLPSLVSRIAFGSCASEQMAQPIWEHVVGARPDVFLFIGDNIYGDTEDMDVLRAKYAKLGAQPGYQKLLASCPILATWDDHDYGVNDGGIEYPKKRESQQVFLDFFGVPKDSPRRSREGVYHAERFGPEGKRLQVILLDTRYHRSPLVRRPQGELGSRPYKPNEDTTTTILGEAQWKWLEEQLRVPADVRVLASSIQVIPEDHGWEKWMNFPHERERLFKLIRDTRARGVIFISGDRHLAELSMMDGGAGYPLYDLTSSALNRSARAWRPYEPNRHRVGTLNWGDNFGVIDVDWEHPRKQIRLQIRDAEGDIAIQRKILLSTINPD
jgi:alkaline phosphatase D